MPIDITTISDLKTHVDGVMKRADHHAQNVYKVVLYLCGLIIWKADSIEARTREGKNANMIWMNIGNKRYAIVFNHENAKIDIRERNQQGTSLLSIDNQTNIDEVINFFESM